MSEERTKTINKILHLVQEVINLAMEYGLTEQEFCAAIAYILSTIYKYDETYYGYVITSSVYLISGGE